jgi:hypothetical protein
MVISAQEGGVITNGRMTLEFPPYALAEDTEITIELLDDGTLGAEFGPHGIEFNRPVILTMDLSDTSAEGVSESVDTYWWNDENLWYEKMPKVGTGSTNTVSAQLSHFSNYHAAVGG